MNEVGLSAAECVDLHPRVGHVSHIFRTARQPCASSINSTGKIRCENHAKNRVFRYIYTTTKVSYRSDLPQSLTIKTTDFDSGSMASSEF